MTTPDATALKRRSNFDRELGHEIVAAVLAGKADLSVAEEQLDSLENQEQDVATGTPPKGRS